MDWKQLLFKEKKITLPLLKILVLIHLIYQQTERNKALDSDTFDYTTTNTTLCYHLTVCRNMTVSV